MQIAMAAVMASASSGSSYYPMLGDDQGAGALSATQAVWTGDSMVTVLFRYVLAYSQFSLLVEV